MGLKPGLAGREAGLPTGVPVRITGEGVGMGLMGLGLGRGSMVGVRAGVRLRLAGRSPRGDSAGRGSTVGVRAGVRLRLVGRGANCSTTPPVTTGEAKGDGEEKGDGDRLKGMGERG